jgi:hypothetical protein
MSSPNQKDFKPLIIHGKNPIKPNEINMDNIQSKKNLHQGGLNAASLERKIDEGKVTVPKTIPLNVANLFRDTRMAMKNADENSLSQAEFAKQSCVPKVDAKFINMLEAGKLQLNTENKITLRSLQSKMKVPPFTL